MADSAAKVLKTLAQSEKPETIVLDHTGHIEGVVGCLGYLCLLASGFFGSSVLMGAAPTQIKWAALVSAVVGLAALALEFFIEEVHVLDLTRRKVFLRRKFPFKVSERTVCSMSDIEAVKLESQAKRHKDGNVSYWIYSLRLVTKQEEEVHLFGFERKPSLLEELGRQLAEAIEVPFHVAKRS